MERIEPNSRARSKWLDYSCHTQDAANTSKKKIEHEAAIKAANEDFERAIFSNADNIWVAHALDTRYESLLEDYKTDEWKKHLEMSMVVTYQNDDPLQCHRGIFRNFYLYESSNHKNLAAKLFSFAAKFTAEINDSKLYVVSDPLEAVRNSLIKILPKGSYYSFNNPWIEKLTKKKLIIKNKVGKEIFDINQENYDKYVWLLKYSSENIFFIASLKDLANAMKWS